MAKIRIPFSWWPEPHQLTVLQHPARFKTLAWHRKSHKTTLALNQLLMEAFRVPDVYWYVAPFFSQAKKIAWEQPDMLPKYVPPEFWKDRNNSELKLRLPNGSMLYVLGAENPEALRGPNPRGVVLDEFADMRPEIWSAVVQPVMMARKDGWCWFVGTPKGKNEFYRRFQYGKAANDPDWFSSHLKASDSGLIPKDALEDAKRTTTAAFYGQEYEVEFIDDASQVFRRVKDNLYDPRLIQPDYSHHFQLGVDLAKTQDWTVITPFDVNTFRVLPQDRFNQIDWSLQKARVTNAYYKHNRGKVVVDSTGIGDPICEDLERDIPSLERFRFTETSRKQLLEFLSISLESDRIKLPNDDGLVEELESFRFRLGERGRIRMEVTEGMTDDRVMSLALAVWGREAKETLITHPGSYGETYQDIYAPI
jgi:phage FluMu gp28-like protein